MKATRREFLYDAAVAGITAMFAGRVDALSAAQASLSTWASRIGLELYTVRDLMATDYVGVLEKVAGIGYKEIEPAGGYGNLSPKDFRALLDRLGRRSCPRAARGATPAAFDARWIPPAGVAPRSNTGGILARRALSGRAQARLGATRDLHHGLLHHVHETEHPVIYRMDAIDADDEVSADLPKSISNLRSLGCEGRAGQQYTRKPAC